MAPRDITDDLTDSERGAQAKRRRTVGNNRQSFHDSRKIDRALIALGQKVDPVNREPVVIENARLVCGDDYHTRNQTLDRNMVAIREGTDRDAVFALSTYLNRDFKVVFINGTAQAGAGEGGAPIIHTVLMPVTEWVELHRKAGISDDNIPLLEQLSEENKRHALTAPPVKRGGKFF